MLPSRTATTRAGTGLVATRGLDAGTVVERFDGPVMKFAEIPEGEITYALLFDGDDWIVPVGPARFLNHSCDPNCVVTDTRDVVTARRVSAGEELTILYNGATMAEWLAGGPGAFFWDDRWTFRCVCGSPRCIGTIDRYVVSGAGDANSRNVFLGITARRGRGVFACRAIDAGETFETCPVIVVPAAQWTVMEQSVLFDYTFGWGPDDKDAAIAGGYGAFYNHSYNPNATYEKRRDDLAIAFVAVRPIAPREEITVNYAGTPPAHGPLWFAVDDPQA